jgi:predicted metalloprotease with PDZ domain
MTAVKRIISTIPPWAFALVFITLFINTTYLIYRGQMPRGGEILKYENDYLIFDYIKPGSPVDKAGIRIGDTLVSMNSIPIEVWEQIENRKPTIDNREAGGGEISRQSAVNSYLITFPSHRSDKNLRYGMIRI